MKHIGFKKEKGQSAVELALVLPILLIIVCGIMDFGWLFYNQLYLNNACREGARYAAVRTVVDDSQTIIESKIEGSLPGSLLDELDIDIIYSNPNKPLEGDVTIVLNSEMKILTPVMGVFYSDQKRPLTATVTMKVET
ncbi:MAG TPA: TadE family protein [Clostridia bacterium]|nr:TadE family protein [Clostridia bacterium]